VRFLKHDFSRRQNSSTDKKNQKRENQGNRIHPVGFGICNVDIS
jgi:hypothetical protein